MIITFPHLGPMAYTLSNFFNAMNVSYIVPPENNKETLDVGIEIAPEEMCLPFKFMVGNLKRAYEMGADTVVMAATCGPCRLGEYGQLMMEVMKKAGCTYNWVLLDSPSVIGIKEFLKRCSVLTQGNNVSSMRFTNSIFNSINMIFRLDRLIKKIGNEAGYLQRPYEAVKLLHEIEAELRNAKNFNESNNVIRSAYKKLEKLKRKHDADPVKILVTGEIYTSIENEANRRLEEKLMILGCSVEKHLNISWWITHTIFDALIPNTITGLFSSKEGIPCNIGGYGRQTVSKILQSDSFDGVIKIMPSGCMPEIVAKAFCEKFQKESNRRILYLIYDELSGEAGYQTRIEAFVDMLERRKYVLDGDRHRFHKHRFRING